ncbi:hypothetical protein RFI_23382 [Reticulomyxa filosa]|uniref:Uncharacterized protein n=1 Tax=Reticulomyxa filosa TaxID=46433 RepID=X6MK06_RETFI|nr:hypothetical protein RFI_23382 [Reticulomyxa filosa]|eukprot:ETO13986.1 hypothetical protein RFI_23382 [Reticulomyxa filosa]
MQSTICNSIKHKNKLKEEDAITKTRQYCTFKGMIENMKDHLGSECSLKSLECKFKEFDCDNILFKDNNVTKKENKYKDRKIIYNNNLSNIEQILNY